MATRSDRPDARPRPVGLPPRRRRGPGGRRRADRGEKEGRFTRKPLDATFPRRAARACLAQAGIASRELDQVVFYEKPLRKFERLLATQLGAFPRSAGAFAGTMFLWLGDRLWLKNRICEELEIEPDKVRFCEHQLAHAASAYFPSPHEEAAVLAVDDFGEWATTALAHGKGGALATLAEIHFPHSLGLVCSALTQFLGFEPGADEGKLEALAAFGRPRFRGALAELVPPLDGGAFAVDQRHLRLVQGGERLFADSLAGVLGPPRSSGSPLRIDGEDARDADLAASLQDLIEERVLALARELHRRTGSDALCFAGQLARNRALAARLLREGPFRSLFVPPDADEAGAALGAALAVHHAAAPGAPRWRCEHARLGLELDAAGREGARAFDDDEAALGALVERLRSGDTVAWARGRGELANESLGARVILAAPHRADARERLLGAVRRSESFLPAASRSRPSAPPSSSSCRPARARAALRRRRGPADRAPARSRARAGARAARARVAASRRPRRRSGAAPPARAPRRRGRAAAPVLGDVPAARARGSAQRERRARVVPAQRTRRAARRAPPLRTRAGARMIAAARRR
jgi:carbamoyltransferase